MLFNTIVFTAFAALATYVQAADSCAAGSILGIYAMCGSFPVDCGKGKCCLQGQKCVADKSGAAACADSQLVSGSTVTVNAACYGSMQSHQNQPTATPTSIPATYVTNPATIATPTNKVQITGAAGSGSGSNGYLSAPYTNGTGYGSGSGPGSGAGSTGAGGASSTGLPQSNSATSAFTSPQSSIAGVLSAVAIVALWL